MNIDIFKGNRDFEKRKIKLYTHKLRIIKFFILSIIMALFAYVSLIMPSSSRKEHKFNFQSKDGKAEAGDADINKKLPEIFQPRFFGEDIKGRPYSIKAHFAKQVDADHIYLRNINGNLNLDNSDIKIIAENGFLLQEKKLVELNGNVMLTTNDLNYKLQAQHMAVDYHQQKAIAWGELVFFGSFGLLTADKLDVDANKNTLTFTKNVKLVLEN
jgi:hypothetical protein